MSDKISLFTEQFEKDLIDNEYFHIKCAKCDYEVGYFFNLHNFDPIVRSMRDHLETVHSLKGADL